jgi:predicted permease
MATLLHDLRYGLRMLLAKPGFTAAAVLTLALGIGANTLVFTLIDGVYLNDLPYRHADELVDVYASQAISGGGVDSVSIPDYVDLHNGVTAFANSALYTDASMNLADGGAPERLRGLRATPSLFDTLGAGAVIGRTFADDDASAGKDHVVVLSDALWRNRFNAEAQILDHSLRLDGESYRVVGVMAPEFVFPGTDIAFFVPFTFTPEQLVDDQRGVNYSAIVARLKPGATRAEAEAQAAALVARTAERVSRSGAEGVAYAQSLQTAGFRFGTRTLREQLSGRNAGELGLLQAAVALVLLIALANVGNLLLTRLSARQGELAVRTALGARRADVMRQLFVEAALLALVSGAVGFCLAWLGTKVVANSGLLPAWAHFGVDVRTLSFTFGVTLLATCAFGLVPALMASLATPQAALRESTRVAGGGQGARRLRKTLVVVQVGLAIALLSGAGLLLRSFANAAAQSPGFNSENLLTAKLTLPATKYPDAAAQARGLRQMLDALQAVPGVESAAATTKLPFGGENSGIYFRIEGAPDQPSPPHGAWRSVDENYFTAMAISVLRGRAFSSADWSAQAKNVVIDTSFERNYFPGGNAIGQRIQLGLSGEGDIYTIVGVAGSVKHFDLTAPAQKPTFYFDLGQRGGDSVNLVLRTRERSPALIDGVRRAVQSVDAEQPLFNIGTLDQRIAQSLTGRRVPLQLLGLFAACALLLAAVGLYGVLAFGVAQRTGEIGLRMAIGADSRRVRRGVLADGARLVAPGLVSGLVCAVLIGFLLKTRLFDVAPVDPASLLGVIAVVALTAFAACWLPAHRAAKLDPLVALRHE